MPHFLSRRPVAVRPRARGRSSTRSTSASRARVAPRPPARSRGDRPPPTRPPPSCGLVQLDRLFDELVAQQRRVVEKPLRVRAGPRLGPAAHDRLLERGEPRDRPKHVAVPVWQKPAPRWRTVNRSASRSQSASIRKQLLRVAGRLALRPRRPRATASSTRRAVARMRLAHALETRVRPGRACVPRSSVTTVGHSPSGRSEAQRRAEALGEIERIGVERHARPARRRRRGRRARRRPATRTPPATVSRAGAARSASSRTRVAGSPPIRPSRSTNVTRKPRHVLAQLVDAVFDPRARSLASSPRRRPRSSRGVERGDHAVARELAAAPRAPPPCRGSPSRAPASSHSIAPATSRMPPPTRQGAIGSSSRITARLSPRPARRRGRSRRPRPSRAKRSAIGRGIARVERLLRPPTSCTRLPVHEVDRRNDHGRTSTPARRELTA